MLPQIAAALLSSEPLELSNVPEVTDVDTMLDMMREFGVIATRQSERKIDTECGRRAQRGGALRYGPPDARQHPRPGAAGRRASVPHGCRCRAGCAIGARPIDLHLKALEALGAEVGMEFGYIHARTKAGGLKWRPHRAIFAFSGSDRNRPDGRMSRARRNRNP